MLETEVGLPTPLDELFHDANVLRLNESARNALSIVTGWQNAREFDITDSVGRSRGTAIEQRRGVLADAGRTFLSGFLSIQFAVYTYSSQQLALTLTRPFFFLFSTMTVTGSGNELLGTVKRKFSLLRKRYELRDARDRVFATIESPLLHPWTYRVFDNAAVQRAEISKKWAGLSEEWVTGAQKFRLDFMNTRWTSQQRAVILAAALSIDFDSFEAQRTKRSGAGAIAAIEELIE